MATTSPTVPGWTTTSCDLTSLLAKVLRVSATSIRSYFSPVPALSTAWLVLPNTSAPPSGATTRGLLFDACALRDAPIVGATSASVVRASVWWFSKQTALWKPGDESFTSAPATSSVSLFTPPGSYGSKPLGEIT